MRKLSIFLILLYLILTNTFSQSENVKNIILLIGDGMGLDQVYAAMTVSEERLNFERAQYIGFSKTWSVSSYITDSGGGATAMATGNKTNNSTISMDPEGNPLKSILKYAEENSKSTGIVTTCELTHATPAAFVANNINRNNYNAIVKDFLNVDVDVLIGGGKNRFDSLGISEELTNKGYQVTYNICDIDLKKNKPIACFVAPVHPKSIIDGRNPEYLESAVNIALQKLSKNENGFFLMVEGSQIDWGGHDNNLEYVITEVLDFDKAIGKAFDFADNHPGTLVIITADHETGGLTLPGGDLQNHKVNGTFSTTGHTGVMVPIYAYGTGAKEFSQIMENTEIFYKMMKAFGFNQ